MRNQDVLYWIWLAEKCGPASKYFNSLMEIYDNPFDIYLLENDEVEQLKKLSKTLRDKLCEKDLERAYEILKFCKQERIDIITYADMRYPERLKNLQDPPVLLYCKGHFPDVNSRLCIGIVGTRKMSEYGKQSAYKIAYELGSADVLTVSGMALGVDGVSACGALAAGGDTVAVLGCGLDTVYPKQHERLMEEIVRHGAVISEYAPKEPPHSYNFPKRNRIISGLCQGVLIVEAAVGSGALITAKDAIAQGREVFAIPGKISDPGAEGPNELIKGGAYTALSADDILKHYELIYGEDYNKDKMARAKRKGVNADRALEKYGLSYGISSYREEMPEERIFEVKRAGSKARVPDEEPQESASKSESVTTPAVSVDSALVEGLDPITRKIYDCLPPDKAVSADVCLVDGLTASDVITSLTLLEISGLVASLPGGMYIRK